LSINLIIMPIFVGLYCTQLLITETLLFMGQGDGNQQKTNDQDDSREEKIYPSY